MISSFTVILPSPFLPIQGIVIYRRHTPFEFGIPTLNHACSCTSSALCLLAFLPTPFYLSRHHSLTAVHKINLIILSHMANSSSYYSTSSSSYDVLRLLKETKTQETFRLQSKVFQSQWKCCA